MRLICPSCGAIASLEAWANDADARAALAALVQLPPGIAPLVPVYLSLFRPQKSALAWRRAATLVAELRELITLPTISVDHKRPLANNPTWWRTALEQIQTQRDKVSRPLANHNYLRTIAYATAEAADAKAEQRHEATATSTHYRLAPTDTPRPVVSEETRRRVKAELAERFQSSGTTNGCSPQSLGEILGGGA